MNFVFYFFFLDGSSQFSFLNCHISLRLALPLGLLCIVECVDELSLKAVSQISLGLSILDPEFVVACSSFMVGNCSLSIVSTLCVSFHYRSLW